MNRIKTLTRAKFSMRRIGLAPEYSPRESRHIAASALQTLARAVTTERVGAHVRPTARGLAAWRAAEKVCGPLTLAGTPREEPDAQKLRESIAEVNTGPCAKWSGAARRALALALSLVESEVSR